MSSNNLFGTDGIRGVVNQYPMTPEVALKCGMASGVFFKNNTNKTRVVIAKDTRLSGYLLESALTSGLVSVGVDVILVGPMPTPAVPMLLKALRADFGIMISASHNPYYDNGLKFFDHNGFKLIDKAQDKLQSLILSDNLSSYLALPNSLGKASRLEDAAGRYIEYVKNSFPKDKTLSNFRIVVDCAHGATYKLAPTIFWELGAEVIEIGTTPNGFNINEGCGSTSPSSLSKKVLETRADIGIALDGDGDRILICDEKGNVIPGDKVLCSIDLYLKANNMLKNDGIVITRISNRAVDVVMAENGIKVLRSDVGDKYVSETMRVHGLNFGGEQSGHIILGDYSTTGDGILSALQVLASLIQSSKTTSAIFECIELYPQITRNIPYDKENPLRRHDVSDKIKALEIEHDARIIVRKSGTERLIRIMIEGVDRNIIDKIANDIEALLT